MNYICNLCPRKCGAVRTENKNIKGICSMPFNLYVAKASLHMWEEPCISGTRGSGTVFFTGCQLQCCFCQNYSISKEGIGKLITVERLSEIFKELEDKGAHNINLVSPTQYVPLIIKAIDLYKPKIPIVYNSSGYELPETVNMLRGYVDIFLLDFKYLSSERALKYSKAPDYPQIAQNAVLEAYNLVGGPIIDKDGIMQKGVIVRHLLMPLGTADACGIIDLLEKMDVSVIFSLMSQYTVIPNIQFPELNRKITKREYEKVLRKFENSSLDGYAQELGSSNTKYIPNFDFDGV